MHQFNTDKKAEICHSCIKVAMIGQNCRICENSAKFDYIFGVPPLQIPRRTENLLEANKINLMRKRSCFV